PLQRVIRHHHPRRALFGPATGVRPIHALDCPGGQKLIGPEATVPLDASPAGRCFTSGQPAIFRGAELDRFPLEILRILRREGVETVCCVPLSTHGRIIGTLNLAARRAEAFPPEDVELLQQVAAQVAIAVENALAFKEIAVLKNKLAEEKLYLEEEFRSEFNLEEIIGESPALKRALSQVELVAPAGTTVLILGETGTGKQLIARP